MSPADFETRRREFCESLDAVAEKLRECARIASDFSKFAARLPPENFVVPNSRPLAISDEGKGKRKRASAPRAKKDPDAPKRPSSAYLHFQNDVRASFKSQHPDLPYSALVEEMAKEWKQLPTVEKEKYQAKVDEDRRRFERETREYMMKKGIAPAEKRRAPSMKVDPKTNAEELKTDRLSPSHSTDDDGSDREENSTRMVPDAASASGSQAGDSHDDEEGKDFI